MGQEAEGARDSGRRRLRWFPLEGTGGQAGAVEDGGNTIRGSGRGRARLRESGRGGGVGRGGGRGPCSSPTAEGRALGRLFALGALGCLGTGSWERADSLQDAPEPKATENEKA